MPSYKPNINEFSKFIVDEKSNDFYLRNQIFIEKQQMRMNQAGTEDSY